MAVFFRRSRRAAAAGAAFALSLIGLAPAAFADPGDPGAPAGGPWDVDTTLPASYADQRLATGGSEGFTCYRIPALTTAGDGTVLAAWDGRPGGCGDAPNPNSIVLRTSDDHGETWSAQRTIAQGHGDPDKLGFSDPSFVVDRETGEIFTFFVMSHDWGWHQGGSNPPANERQVMDAVYISSRDGGQTWSEPVEVTGALDPGGAGEVFNGRFAASGEGIQLRYGEYAGRLIQQYTVRDLSRGGGMYAVSLYSDDHGATWHAGAPVGPNLDENKVVELSDGRVMLNSRSSGRSGGRWIAYSSDGGETYTDPVFDTNLPDPRNNASIIRAFPNADQGSDEAKVLLFSNANATSRSNGTIRVSYDDGQTWPDAKVFEPGGMSYSTLTTLADGSIGLLYEPGGQNIQFARFTWAWLDAAGVTITAADRALHRGDDSIDLTIGNLGPAGDLPAGSLSIDGTLEVTAADVPVPAIAAGAQATITVPVTIGEFVDPGDLHVTAAYTAGGTSIDSPLTLPVQLQDGQIASTAIPQSAFTASASSTPQPGHGPESMFDGDTGTRYHTAWYTGTDDTEVPGGFTVDLGDAQDLAYITLVPRADGLNGTIGRYRILSGTDADSLTEHSTGTWPANSDPRRVYFGDESTRYVRVEAVSTYGDTADKWISVAEFEARRVGREPLLDISLTLAGEPADSYAVGDRIPVAAHVENTSDETLDAVPRAGEWRGLYPGCRYVGMEPGFGYDCTAEYVVTQADLDRGYVDLGQTWAVDDENIAQNPATDPIQELVIAGPRVNLGIHATNLGAWNPPAPAEIVAGTQLTYRFQYSNTTNATVALVPIEGDFSGFHITETPNCRYGALAPGADPICSTAVYTVTADDVSAGFIAPPARFAVGPNASGADPFFVLDVPAPRIDLPEPAASPTIATISGVEGVTVAYGTSEADALAALPATTTVTDSDGGTHTVDLTWTIADYDGHRAGDHAAIAVFALPDGLTQTDPATPLEVAATITVDVDESDGTDGGDSDDGDGSDTGGSDSDGGNPDTGDSDGAGSGTDAGSGSAGPADPTVPTDPTVPADPTGSAGAAAGADQAPPQTPGGELPDTGTAVGTIALLSAALAVAGAVFVLRSRRRSA
ncbi:LPXTG cell wall anchor domain-containing protein [Pseudactinotalea sp. HY160]|uniref:exo-alpha-sialidase n=1 Tax=Pseudactinotalea sp. HY160 TaxID=2654490 RepID=UPI00128D3F0B|nr:exo-alpha-sialidase [Pseudactinotalea sp. HY160]MPV50811.1 LPXTG cell wall anchor domain-containing protein [Pseudactinotalea sp. HY160]